MGQEVYWNFLWPEKMNNSRYTFKSDPCIHARKLVVNPSATDMHIKTRLWDLSTDFSLSRKYFDNLTE